MLEDDPFFTLLKRFHEMCEETLSEYKARMERFGNYCAVCGRVGQEVVQSIEGKGYYYCKDSKSCKKSKR